MLTIEKQSWEKFPIYGSILNVQEADEVVVLATSKIKAWDKDNKEVTSAFLDNTTKALADDPDGKYIINALAVRCQDGIVAKSPYTVTFYMITDNGNQWEADMKVKIKEQGPI